MSASRAFAILSFLFVAGCSTAETRMPAQATEPAVAQVPTRDEIMGPNRARVAVLAKSNRDYIFRNVASAFPDTGKNMLLKDRALPKSTVSGALDHSPWHLRIYNDPVHIAENQARFSNMNKNFYSTPLTQREALLLTQNPKKEASPPFYQTENGGRDDAFEPNNTIQEAFDLTDSEDRWISLLGAKDGLTEGIQSDEDWYKIFVSPQYRRLILDLRFQHYLGDVDMKLFDAKGNLVAVSQGNGDDEFIHMILDYGGVYYVQIYGSNRANHYDLKYSTYFTGGSDDEYEENDTLKTAFDLRPYENQWLSEIRGEGVAADDDYYKISVPQARERVLVDLRYDVDRGDVDVRLMTSEGKTIASSANIGNDDFIDFTVSHPGIYYLKVYPFSPQSTFNMYDLKWSSQKPTRNGTAKSSTKLSESNRGAGR